MLRVVYDPINGEAVRDGEVHAKWDRIVDRIHDQTDIFPSIGNPPFEVVFSTNNMMLAFQVVIRKKRIPLELVQVWYRSPDNELGPEKYIQLKIYPSGGITPRPQGFSGDLEFNLYVELL